MKLSKKKEHNKKQSPEGENILLFVSDEREATADAGRLCQSLLPFLLMTWHGLTGHYEKCDGISVCSRTEQDTIP